MNNEAASIIAILGVIILLVVIGTLFWYRYESEKIEEEEMEFEEFLELFK